jgi:hypothetical protein
VAEELALGDAVEVEESIELGVSINLEGIVIGLSEALREVSDDSVECAG